MTINSRTTETAYFFLIMGNLAAAKAANDLEGIADSIADLEMVAMHFDAPSLAHRAGIEAERATTLLADLQSQRFGYAGPMVVLTRADVPANLSH